MSVSREIISANQDVTTKVYRKIFMHYCTFHAPFYVYLQMHYMDIAQLNETNVLPYLKEFSKTLRAYLYLFRKH